MSYPSGCPIPVSVGCWGLDGLIQAPLNSRKMDLLWIFVLSTVNALPSLVLDGAALPQTDQVLALCIFLVSWLLLEDQEAGVATRPLGWIVLHITRGIDSLYWSEDTMFSHFYICFQLYFILIELTDTTCILLSPLFLLFKNDQNCQKTSILMSTTKGFRYLLESLM